MNSQTCTPTGIQGTTIHFLCNQTCRTIEFRIPHLKSTDHYTVSSVPFAPYPFNNPTGTVISSIYIDDRYSPLIPMPFGFCFYGSTYNNMVVGSNGVITFEALCANANNAYTLTVGGQPQPIPYNGGAGPTGIATTYYPRTAIMGAYHDIDPSASPLPTRRIEYNVFGTAPCRKLVVSFLDIRMYSCTSLICSQQMVLHESTGIIEVFLVNKPVCPGWNQGLAILGIQDETRTKAVAAPGKNCTQWSESNTGYRFTPAGNTSRFVISELLDMAGNVIAVADTQTVVPGMLDLRFNNFCPPAGTNQYIVRTQFSSCISGQPPLISSDTITITRDNSLGASATSTPASCGGSDGTITVTVPAGVGTPPYTYVLDGGTPVTGGSPYTFTNVAAGPHTVNVTDASGGCTSSLNVNVNASGNINITTSVNSTSCVGVNNGSITVTSAGGTGPYTFSINGGAAVPGTIPYTFSNLPAGNHVIRVNDLGTGCNSGNISINVPVGAGVSGTASTTPASCAQVSNGTITVTANTGTPPFSWSLNGGPFVPGPNPFTFTNLPAGNHTVTIRDNNNCSILIPVTISVGPGVTGNATSTATSCPGVNNGTITVTATNGTPPFTWSLNGAPPVPGNNPYTFTGVPPGNHTVRITDQLGCFVQIPVTVNQGPPLTTTASVTNVLCFGGNSGSIQVQPPSGGTPPFSYSLDGTNWQSQNTFTGLTAGTYIVYFRDNVGCTGQLSVTIHEPAEITATLSATPVTCNGGNDGKITVNANGGVSPYEYSMNNGNTWVGSNEFTVPAGNYTILVRDANQCVKSFTVSVTEPLAISVSATTTPATCDGGNDGTITVSATGGNAGGYSYSIDGTQFQSSSVFQVAPGNYTITVKDPSGCTGNATVVVELNNNLTFTPQQDVTLCEGNSTSLNFISNANEFSWSPATGLSNTSIPNPTANPTTTTQYIVTATLGRCQVKDTVVVHVNPAPIPNAGPDVQICYGQTYQLQASGGVRYLWTPSTYLNNNTIPNPISSASQTITYTLQVVADANGCQSLTTDEITIDVTPPIKVYVFPSDTILYSGDQIQLRAVPTVSSVNTFLWTPAGYLNNPNVQNPLLTAPAVGEEIIFKVSARNPAGCLGEGFTRVKIYKGPELYTPTAFTPNGDGKNDVFYPFPVGIASLRYFKVFNRWGQLVFSTQKLQEGWNGKWNGIDQPAGTYVWVAEAVDKNNKTIFRKGTVMLIR
ncbi:MAG: gliding motility-associated C-terminal domain-containing protein [Chitinophagaceae bacterium]|nr:gliding motility-associated C-terminal domain-containing protein [Chitinophagaceae bacterium]